MLTSRLGPTVREPRIDPPEPIPRMGIFVENRRQKKKRRDKYPTACAYLPMPAKPEKVNRSPFRFGFWKRVCTAGFCTGLILLAGLALAYFAGPRLAAMAQQPLVALDAARPAAAAPAPIASKKQQPLEAPVQVVTAKSTGMLHLDLAVNLEELLSPEPELRFPVADFSKVMGNRNESLPIAVDVPTQTCGTSVNFVANPIAAARKAAREDKLLFMLHVSGNFEDPAFT